MVRSFAVRNFFRRIARLGSVVLLAAVAAVTFQSSANASVIVADRIGQRLLAYTDDGVFSHVVGTGIGGGGPAGGLAFSPNGQYLYATGLGGLHRFDWNATTFTATNRVAIPNTQGTSVISSPAGLLFDADTLFVGNRGATTVAQLNVDGSAQVANLTGGPTGGRTGIVFNSLGQLLVGNFTNGAIHRYDSTGYLNDLVPTTANGGVLATVAAMQAVGTSLYVVAGQTNGKFAKLDLNTGAYDLTFGTNGIISTDASTGGGALNWPSSISLAPGGNGLLVGILTNTNGAGYINQYGFDGTYIGRWATNSTANAALGFGEPTGLLYTPIPVPEPSSIALCLIGFAALGWKLKRRNSLA